MHQSSRLRVIAAIMHQTGRILAVQRVGSRGWQPPTGNTEPGESIIVAARRHVRHATGFEITPCGMFEEHGEGERSLVVVRCRVRGVGADISPDVRAMRWLTRVELLSQTSADWTDSLLRALEPDRSAGQPKRPVSI
ncbi:MAG: NUDIX domain-containing protein [Actinobacteria bacterium]|nr:NUDIX domain-containing protein [Actinomycetota bacterium]